MFEILTSKETVEDDVSMSLWHLEPRLPLVTLGKKGYEYYTKHRCLSDLRVANMMEIAQANPIVKTEKFQKI
ncbi:hypothetical protein Taro_049102 [Colocasia esculenta]|uniref:Uncharacterized protein n=1 Tax=Colocasia esculenta TaxID=4460 RepID=A0A843X9V2_COLES|nr:hypothetical protein [Colocasia esculenta]